MASNFPVATQQQQQGQGDACYFALLGLAEHFRTSSPPNYRLCIQCLQGIMTLKTHSRIEARTHLQLGSLFFHHTKDVDLARSHLEKSVSIRIGLY